MTNALFSGKFFSLKNIPKSYACNRQMLGKIFPTIRYGIVRKCTDFFPTPFTGVIVFIKEEERPDGASQTEQDGGIPQGWGQQRNEGWELRSHLKPPEHNPSISPRRPNQGHMQS